MRTIAPIELMVEEYRWTFAKFLYERRCQEGVSWQSLADVFQIHRSTARIYGRMYELALRYGSGEEQAPSCNAITRTCIACSEKFIASRADAQYCSNACRQDAYRLRKRGAVA